MRPTCGLRAGGCICSGLEISHGDYRLLFVGNSRCQAAKRFFREGVVESRSSDSVCCAWTKVQSLSASDSRVTKGKTFTEALSTTDQTALGWNRPPPYQTQTPGYAGATNVANRTTGDSRNRTDAHDPEALNSWDCWRRPRRRSSPIEDCPVRLDYSCSESVSQFRVATVPD